MRKKILIGGSLLSVGALITTPLIVLTSQNKNEQGETIAKNIKSLKNEYNNKELLTNSNDINEELATKAKNNIYVQKWIKKIAKKKEHIYEEDRKDLYNLPISIEIKKFMERNLKEKYDFRRLKKEANNKKMVQYSSGYVKNANNQNVLSKINNKPIPLSGQNNMVVHDYWFKDDVSYIWWNNQKVYNLMAKTLDPNFVKEANNIKNTFSRFFTRDRKTIILNAGSLLTLGTASLLTKTVTKGAILSQKISVNLGVGIASGKFPMALTKQLVSHATNKESEIHYWVKNLIDTSITTILSITSPLGMVISGIWDLMHIIGPGNDASFIENWNDHGLNDFKFQMNHNLYNMAHTAHNFSLDYSSGIEWKVTDGWFTFPEIYVGTDKSGYPWKFISPGTSFNFGHKLKIWYP
ncbi:MAG: hypothetical protein HRT98_03345 [Mycoplasmatales bacterium]|nr:hypothetical protein [Mycoplasmatales bacterium]